MNTFDKCVTEIKKLIRQSTVLETDEAQDQIIEVKHALQSILKLVLRQNECFKRELSDAEESAVAFESLWLEAKSKNEEYEQVLGFYANKDNYMTNIRDDDFKYYQAVFYDNGKMARQALKLRRAENEAK